MLVKLDGSKKQVDRQGFDRSVVKDMVTTYRKTLIKEEENLKYAHFNAYEILELFIANGVLSKTIGDYILREKDTIKKSGLKIYLGKHTSATLPPWDLGGPNPYEGKTTTILCNTKIGHGYRDMLTELNSVSLASDGEVKAGQGLDQAEIAPPYHSDEDDDFDIGYE